MVDTSDDDDREKPLDPALLQVQARLQRLMLWSRGIMLVGFAALFGVIFYKFYWTRPTGPAPVAGQLPGQPVISSLPLPEGGRVISTQIDGPRLVLTIETPSATVVLQLDADTLQVLRRLELTRHP